MSKLSKNKIIEKKKTKKQPDLKSSKFLLIKLPVILLVIIWLTTSFFKIYLYNKNTHFIDKKEDIGLFKLESAFRYRYVKMIAEGGEIPNIDYKAQYPEGLEVYKHIMITSESVIGKLYYLFCPKKIPLHIFLVYFMFFFSSLSVIPVYLSAKELTKNRWGGIIASVFYVTAFSSIGRTIYGGYVEEDFALPFIFSSLYLFLQSINSFNKKNLLYSILSGIFLFIALTSWHFTQFYFYLLLVYVVIQFFRNKEVDLLLRSFIILIIFNIIAGLTIPQLKAKQIIFSLPMVVSYALILTYFVKKAKLINNRWLQIFFFLFISIVFVISISALLGEHTKEYSHAFTLLIYKIKFLGNKPTEAELSDKIPFDAKIMWKASAFHTPSIKNIITNFLWLFILTLLSIIDMVYVHVKNKKQFSLYEDGILYFLLSFLGIYILAERMYVFLIFPVAILSGRVIMKYFGRYFMISFIIFGLIVFFQTSKLISLTSAFIESADYKLNIVKWIQQNTKSTANILGDIDISTEILAYTDRPIIIHNMFESKDIREKVKSYYETLYKNEEEFYVFCNKYKVNYIIHRWENVLDATTNSIRYVVNVNRIDKNSVVYLFNFKPQELKHFILVHQNNYYRIYNISGIKEKHPPKFSYVPFFNERLFVQDNSPTLNDEYSMQTLKKIWQIPNIQKEAEIYYKKKMFNKVLELCQKIVNVDPYDPYSHLYLGEYYLSLRMYKEAIHELEITIELDNTIIDAYYPLGVAYYEVGNLKQSKIILEKFINLSPTHKDILLAKEILQDINNQQR